MRAAIAIAVAVAAAAALAGTWPAAAAERERTGEEIVKQPCSACHATGKYGAPRIDDREAWIARMRNGLDATVRSAIRGHGKMPARGGMADLTDSELRSAVLYMFNTAGPPTPPPPPPAPGPNQRVAGGMDIFLGVVPVKDGRYHVNVTIRDSATHAIVEDAQVEASVTNPVMGSETRKLARDTVDKSVSYGSDFRMSGIEPHTITVRIRRPQSTGVTEAKFDFRS